MRHRAVRGVASYLPQSEGVEEVHLPCQVAEPRQKQEPAVRGPGDGVAVRCSELIYALCLAVEQRDVAGHITRCYYKS
jgi:hypothetical protein